MTLETEEILNINLTLPGIQLLNSDAPKEHFERLVGAEVIEETQAGTMGFYVSINFSQQADQETLHTPVAPPPPPRRWRIARDRILLDLLPDRTTIVKEYPNSDDIDRFAEVVGIAFKQTNFDVQQLRRGGYGLNIEAMCRLASEESATQFLVNQLYTPNIFQREGYGVDAEILQLRLHHDQEQWRVQFRPRLPNDRILIGLSLLKQANGGLVPSAEDLSRWFTQAWKQMGAIIELLKKE